MSDELYYDSPRGAKMHWSKDGLHCIHCGSVSNLSHYPSCPNYGLWDNDGNPIPALPCGAMSSRQNLLENLRNIGRSTDNVVWRDVADNLLLDYIDDPEIREAFNEIPRYAYFTKDIKVTREDLGVTNPEASPILRYFNYLHLPEHLQEVSRPFCELAERMDVMLRNGPEKSVALRKLLEAKDAAVRSRL